MIYYSLVPYGIAKKLVFDNNKYKALNFGQFKGSCVLWGCIIIHATNKRHER